MNKTQQGSFWCRYLQCDSNTKQHQVTLFILGEMFGWGNTVNGELGLGGIEEEQILSPRELKFSKATQVQQVACGTNHTAVVTKDGQVYTCGSNDYSQLGHNKPRKRLEQVDGLSAYVINNVACGMAHSVAVNEWGQVFSWGSNMYGQLAAAEDTQLQSISGGWDAFHILLCVVKRFKRAPLTERQSLVAL
uniref:Uncharacterized protein n=1 Tax=Timema monikensis TaxID=170555 RepID=A0A7R9EIN3_9NEOP|nr:unnamed protein product [Timema monikensis]